YFDARAGFGFVYADYPQFAPQAFDLVADIDPAVRGLPEINDREIAGLWQRLALDDAQIAGGGEALKIYAVNLANAEAAAHSHLPARRAPLRHRPPEWSCRPKSVKFPPRPGAA